MPILNSRSLRISRLSKSIKTIKELSLMGKINNSTLVIAMLKKLIYIACPNRESFPKKAEFVSVHRENINIEMLWHAEAGLEIKVYIHSNKNKFSSPKMVTYNEKDMTVDLLNWVVNEIW